MFAILNIMPNARLFPPLFNTSCIPRVPFGPSGIQLVLPMIQDFQQSTMAAAFRWEGQCIYCTTNALACNKKLSDRRGTARFFVSVEILPVATQQCRNYSYDKSWTNRSYEVGGLQCRRKQPVFSSFSPTVQSSGVAWTWAATLTPWWNLANMCTQPWRDRVAFIVL